MGRKVFTVQMDVTSESSVNEAIRKTMERVSCIHILVNNAGYYGKIQEGEDDCGAFDFDSCYEVNLKGVWTVTSKLMPYFKTNKCGKIINIGSVAGRKGHAFGTAYCASKAAVISLTQSLASLLGPYNINVNAICPGDILTEMTENLLPHINCDTPEDYKKLAKATTCLEGPLATEDVAYAAVFFASAAANNITGQALNVDCGLAMN